MKTIGLFDAKTHFSQFVEEVYKQQESIVITRRGEKVAMLIPYKQIKRSKSKAVYDAFISLQNELKSNHVTQDEIKSWKSEGRR